MSNYVAACELLDEEYPPIPGALQNDSNTYTRKMEQKLLLRSGEGAAGYAQFVPIPNCLESIYITWTFPFLWQVATYRT